MSRTRVWQDNLILYSSVKFQLKLFKSISKAHYSTDTYYAFLCVCAYVRACVRACV